ncbi:hypothetical protein AMAG_09464 [Allomyces macrogynus ATCC 38327]|uniref:CCD97-like C-terminal domain-containing protein n=1 Tax=Allomyces macrogynus (strain ATCC 38327) TaxID=578462 RepID=A0A0L0SPM5_ALLM3|nr:hypothetical protein AMAG_09464 [Allomyces macrogynus ATCC 38327]|eukprot:KNE64442.1 hypothetical protein AMAG_09464 [Allomyces macrogynus ATCC 38327]
MPAPRKLQFAPRTTPTRQTSQPSTVTTPNTCDAAQPTRQDPVSISPSHDTASRAPTRWDALDDSTADTRTSTYDTFAPDAPLAIPVSADAGPSRRPTSHSARAQVRNRRRMYLDRVLLPGGYFAESTMQLRAPRLYRDMVSRLPPRPRNDDRNGIVASLFDCIDAEAATVALAKGEAQNDEEADSDEEKGHEEQEEDEIPPDVHEERVEELRQAMVDAWLAGEDATFDYSIVDGNAEYDDLATMAADDADAYFDAEEPESDGVCTGTGILDY